MIGRLTGMVVSFEWDVDGLHKAWVRCGTVAQISVQLREGWESIVGEKCKWQWDWDIGLMFAAGSLYRRNDLRNAN